MVISTEYIAGFFDGEGSIGIYRNIQRGYWLKTQLTQNKSKQSKLIFDFLLEKYGGSVSEQKTLSGNIKYNWQLGSDNCVLFLGEILPFLILKEQQALLACWWQGQRPEIVRNERGRIALKAPRNLELDEAVYRLMRELKTKDIDTVMENSKELVTVQHTLKQIVNVKGN